MFSKGQTIFLVVAFCVFAALLANIILNPRPSDASVANKRCADKGGVLSIDTMGDSVVCADNKAYRYDV